MNSDNEERSAKKIKASNTARVRYFRKRVLSIIGKDDYAMPESQKIIDQNLDKIRKEEYKKSADAIRHCIQELENQCKKKYNFATQGRPRKYEGDAKQRYYASVYNMIRNKLAEREMERSIQSQIPDELCDELKSH
jgi:hypothetical protein